MDKARVGIRPPCAKRQGASLPGVLKKEVAFEPVDADINDRIDEAYRVKYRGSAYLNPMIGARARAATVRIIPRDPDSASNRTERKSWTNAN
jgi:hypothetical protein